jgi:ornithine carbamoyltransferase
MGQRESIADVARVLGGYVQGVMARVFAHDHVVELAKWSPVPVINGLSDYSHPCQILADALTIQEHFGTLRGLKLSYVGDTNNVTRSLLALAAKFGLAMSVASPKGYQLDEATRVKTLELAQQTGAHIELLESPTAAVKNADVIYTDTWTSMGQEAESAERRKVFPPYQVNTALLGQAAKRAIVLHCLPAHRGEEITDEVADGAQSAIFPQAENRLHAQKALLVKLMGR